jgi:serine/threonine-protein kinase
MIAGYDILGVAGRGAMGVVYKARQRGLNRIVALKMILAGPHADQQELMRFRREAEAVAGLQHSNIVQIYEVGDENGSPFFSYEFVDGVTLDKKIAGTPQPAAEAARLALTLAQAMDYAHRQGIIHRDLKPANILLTTDGTPKIGDFGLAKRLAEDSGQTRTGTILGTPSYMAPEQAAGRAGEVGPLSDVYSLGAVLYDLLTGRAPFRAASVLDTLEQVRTRDPVAPAQLEPGVPRDLETICLKCLQKEPARRYSNAAALAEDLRRFLSGEPISARPVSRAERLWRWCKRNPRVALLSGTVAALVVIWALTSSALAWRLKLQKDETDRARMLAVDNAAEAREQANIALHNEQKAENAAHEAKVKHEQAAARMIDLVEKLQNRMRSKRLSANNGPQLRLLRDDMLGMLRQSMLAMVKDMDKDGVSTFGEARTYQMLGNLMKKLGQGQEAQRLYRQAHAMIKKVADDEPGSDLARANLGVMLLALGDMDLDLNGDGRAALASYLQARDLQQQIFSHPRSGQYTQLDNKRILSHDDYHLGRAYLYLGDPVAARTYFQECQAYRAAWSQAEANNVSARSYLGEAHLWLGIVAWHLADAKAMEDNFAKAASICEELARQHANYFPFKADLAELYGHKGDAQLRLGRVDGAEKCYRQSLQHLQAVVAHDPDDASQLPLLALTHERLAVVALRRRKPAEAEQHYQESRRLREELAQTEPNNLSWQADYLLALARCSQHAEVAGAAEKLCRRVPRSTELLLQIARCYAVCSTRDTPAKARYRQRALEVLQAATGDGYRDAAVLNNDPELEVLGREPAYQAILARVKVGS